MFTVTRLMNNRALVEGTDVRGRTGLAVLDTWQWDSIEDRLRFQQAESKFEQVVEDFFAPLLQGAEEVAQETAPAKPDPISYVIFAPGAEGVEAKEAEVMHLNTDSIVLRLIEEDPVAPRLRWVTDSQLEVVEVVAEDPTFGEDPGDVTEPGTPDDSFPVPPVA